MSTATRLPHSARPQFTLLGLLALPVLGMLVFVVCLLSGVSGPDIPIVGLAIATACLALVPLVLDTLNAPERRHLLLSLFGLANLPYFVAPIFLSYLPFDPRVDEVTVLSLAARQPPEILTAQVLVVVALLSVFVGYALPLGRVLGQVLPQSTVEWRPLAAVGVALVMIPLGWLVFLSGEFGLLPKAVGSGFVGSLSSWSYFGFSLLTFVYMRYGFRPARTAIFVLIPMAMAFNFFTGSKTLFLSPLAMVAISYLLYHRRIGIRWILLGFLAIALFYPLAEFYRWQIQHPGEGGLRIKALLGNPGYVVSELARFISASSSSDWLLHGLQSTVARFDGLAILSAIVRDVPDVVPYQGGWTIGYIFISYIPRIIWAGKPDTGGVGLWVTENFGAGPGFPTATGPTWIGELYFNFGYLGVVPGMMLVGLFFRVLHENVFRERATIPALLAGVMTLYVTAPRLQSGLVGAVNGVVFNLGLLVGIHMVVRLLSGRSAAPVRTGTEPPGWAPTGVGSAAQGGSKPG